MQVRSSVARVRLAALLALAVAATAVGLGAAGPATADTAPPAGTPPTVSADPLPTAQIDGVVWSQVTVGTTVYAAGRFTRARPAGAAPGTSTVVRSNLLAYSLTTGALTSFAPTLNAQALVVTASPDGSTIYVGGDFTSVNNQGRQRVAAFSTATGALRAFAPAVGNQVRTITATPSTVYVGGTFTSVNGVARRYVAAVSAASGATLNWDPSPDAMLYASTLNASGSKLVIAGRFQNVGGQPWYGMAAVDPTTGVVVPWAATAVVRNAGPNSSLYDLKSDAQGVYGTGYHFGAGGNLEGAFRAHGETGAIQWLEDCHGDTVSIFPRTSVVYVVGHPHYCGNIGGFPQTEPWTMYHSLSFTNAATRTVSGPDPHGYHNFGGQPGPSLLNWFPTWNGAGSVTHQGQAGWNVTGNDQYIAIGGEFTGVNGTAQQGLVRFAVSGSAPNRVGPNTNDALTPSATSPAPGQARISWQATHDRDNVALTYKVFRNFQSLNDTPVHQRTVESTFWQRPTITWTDTSVTPGQAYNYRVYAFDPFGNLATRGSATVTVRGGAASVYASSVFADSPTSYFRLDEPTGSTVVDSAGGGDAVAGGGVTRGVAGALLNEAVPAAGFSGSVEGVAAQQALRPGPTTFSVEAWVRTSSSQGGKVVGFGNSPGGTSGNYDRHLYLDDAGRLHFGVYSAGTHVVSTPGALNDGQWHHVVGTLSAAGQVLYVDGQQVAADAGSTQAQAFSGVWRLGGDNLDGWPNQPTSRYLAGTIDEVAVYPTALPLGRVRAHYTASGRSLGGGLVLARDDFGRTVSGGLGSADEGGPWALSGTAADFSVGGGTGNVRLPAAGSGRQAVLGIASADSDVRVTVGLDKPATGGGTYVGVVGRGNATTAYRGRALVAANGAVTASLTRVVGGPDVGLGTAATGVTLAAGQRLALRMQAVGTSPTTLRLKVWRDGTAEPAAWLLTATDSTAALQSAGGAGLWSYLSGSASNAPVTLGFDGFVVARS